MIAITIMVYTYILFSSSLLIIVYLNLVHVSLVKKGMILAVLIYSTVTNNSNVL